jgi:uncharacterized protein YjbI with pentapeptide repeats
LIVLILVVEGWREGAVPWPLLGGAVAASALALFIRACYTRGWSVWSGFATYPAVPGSRAERRKTLWDWMGLLIIPAVLAAGALWFNAQQSAGNLLASKQQHESDLQIAQDQQQETALQGYLDQMSNLMLAQQLGSANDPDATVVQVARAQTLTALSEVGPARKAVILRFLWEAHLIDMAQMCTIDQIVSAIPRNQIEGDPATGIIPLDDADLDGATLGSSFLCGAALQHVNLQHADLSEAILSYADLQSADLAAATLSSAHLDGADLTTASLAGANLHDATFVGVGGPATETMTAMLEGANLSGANLSGADMEQVLLMTFTGSGLEPPIVTDLSGADLRGTDLARACMWGVNLRGADLRGADLQGADLSPDPGSGVTSDLRGADLRGVDLRGADLRGADVTAQQLAAARSLAGAIMPDGARHA